MAERHQVDVRSMWGEVLDWSATQGYIVTGGQTAQKYYKKGIDYKDESDCPHYHKMRGDTAETFRKWRLEAPTEGEAAMISGAWHRPMFYGGWKESTGHDTTVYNIQTPSLFVDLRIPTARPKMANVKSMQDLSLNQLLLLTRQHCFAGYSKVEKNDSRRSCGGPVAVRHHCIDWNSTIPRLLPNKWRVELSEDGSSFKEWCYALDDFNQSIYMERWQRYDGDGGRDGPTLAMRKAAGQRGPDTVVVICGNHFVVAIDRPPLPPRVKPAPMYAIADDAWERKDREVLECLVGLCGMYGRVKNDLGNVDWRVQASTHPWWEGTAMFRPGQIRVESKPSYGPRGELGAAVWDGVKFDVYDCTFTAEQLSEMFGAIRSRM